VGKKNQFVKVISMGTAIAFSNLSVVSAEPTSISNVKSIAPQVAQASDAPSRTEDIIKPAQQAIPSTEELNPSGNPLSFPTQPGEVEVDEQQLITLEQATELSLKNNKEIEEARIQVERAEAVLRQERAALFPTLDLTSGATYGNDFLLDSITQQTIDQNVQDAVDNGIPEEQARAAAEDQLTNTNSNSFDFSGDLALSYEIFTSGRRGASIRTAEKQLQSSKLNLESIVEQARFETSRDYYSLQNNDAQVEIQKAAVEDATQTLRDAQLRERAGLGTRFDVLTAEAELAQSQQSLTTERANQSIARRQLAETLSVSHSTDLSTADAVKQAGVWNLKLSETIVQAFKNRAELEQLLLQREIGDEQQTVALSQARPTVAATAGYTLTDDFEDDFDPSDRYTVGLNLQWRLFDGGAARAAAQQAEKDGEIAETQFANQRNQIRFLVEQAFFQLKSNQSNIGLATTEAKLAEESLRLARLRFQAGVGTQTDVIDAQTRLTTARGNLLASIIDYNQSYAELQRQVSNTPDNSLQDLP
jgi:outer membrane factor, OMF family